MNELKKSLNFIKENKNYIYFSLFLFLFFSFLGFFFPLFEKEILSMLENLKKLFEGRDFLHTFFLIFFNNSRSSLLALVLGIFFGIFPFIIIMTNGYILGFVTRMVVEKYSFLEMWRIFPHGIFELPAIFISVSLGLKIGHTLIKTLSIKKSFSILESSLKTFVLIVIPLLFLAALIESILMQLT